MDADIRSPPGSVSESHTDDGPDISICESCPGKFVFLESENTDGWIASDLTVDVTR